LLAEQFDSARSGRELTLCGRCAPFAEAIAEYEKAYEFFSRHSWLDRFRYLTVLSSSAYSYREAALCGIAFAYSQMGDGANAAKFYQRALTEFPGCAVARTSLKAMEASHGKPENRTV
jgi:tetratricopeptide (TPR) repeat protein